MKNLKQIKEGIRKWYDLRHTHRTDNTKTLDNKFDPCSEYKLAMTLGKTEYEGLGAYFLNEAKKTGYFKAFPIYSPTDRIPLIKDIGFDGCSKRIESMVDQCFLILETLNSGVKVISPSEKMAFRMYGKDKFGNEVQRRQLSAEELRQKITVKDLVNSMYAS